MVIDDNYYYYDVLLVLFNVTFIYTHFILIDML